MNHVDLLFLYDQTMREHAHPAGLIREATQHTARYTTESGSLRYILWHRFDEAVASQIVTNELQAVDGKAASIMWKLYAHDKPSSALVPYLLASGFKPENDYANELMMASIDDIVARLGEASSPDLEVRELVTAQSLDAYQSIWDAVWPESPNARYVNDHRLLAARGDTGIQFFAGFDRGEPVTSGYMYHHPRDPVVLLCGGATHLAVEASPDSAPILKRLGFASLSTLVFYERDV